MLSHSAGCPVGARERQTAGRSIQPSGDRRPVSWVHRGRDVDVGRADEDLLLLITGRNGDEGERDERKD